MVTKLADVFWDLEQDPDPDEYQNRSMASAWYRVMIAVDPARGYAYTPFRQTATDVTLRWRHWHTKDGPACENVDCAESSTYPPREYPIPDDRRDWWKLPPGADPQVDEFMARFPRADAERRAAVMLDEDEEE